VGWKWKAGACPPPTGSSTCKSSLQEAISVRLHLPTTKFGGMWTFLTCCKITCAMRMSLYYFTPPASMPEVMYR
jgi:hypothetical protein